MQVNHQESYLRQRTAELLQMHCFRHKQAVRANSAGKYTESWTWKTRRETKTTDQKQWMCGWTSHQLSRTKTPETEIKWNGSNSSCRRLGRRHLQPFNPLQCKGNYSVTSNNMKFVHWSLMGGLLHLVQQRGDWAGLQPAQGPSSLYQI